MLCFNGCNEKSSQDWWKKCTVESCMGVIAFLRHFIGSAEMLCDPPKLCWHFVGLLQSPKILCDQFLDHCSLEVMEPCKMVLYFFCPSNKRIKEKLITITLVYLCTVSGTPPSFSRSNVTPLASTAWISRSCVKTTLNMRFRSGPWTGSRPNSWRRSTGESTSSS